MADKLIIGADGSQTRVAMSNPEILAIWPKRIAITLSKDTILADGIDTFTISIQLEDGLGQAIEEQVTLRAVLPDHTWVEFQTDASGFRQYTVDAVWPETYEIIMLDPAGNYPARRFTITTTGDYPSATGSAQFTLGEAWRNAYNAQVAEDLESVSLEDAISAVSNLSEAITVMLRMYHQYTILAHFVMLRMGVNVQDIKDELGL